MKIKSLYSIAAGLLAWAAATIAPAQTYSNAVISLNPVGYWPLNETTQPTMPLNISAVNFGSLGAPANAFYGAWYQAAGNTWYLTNNIIQTNAVTFPFDGSKAMFCQGAGPGQYVILPRNTNGVPNSSLTLNPPFSIEAWIQIGRTSSALGDIISEGCYVPLNTGGPNTNNPFNGGLGTGWAGVELAQYQDYLAFTCQSTNGESKANELDTTAYNAAKGFKVGQWVHVVATFDGTTETMYTNGVFSVSKKVGANPAGLNYVPDPTTPLMIGSGSDVPIVYGTAFQGAIQDVAIYTNILPVASIVNHFQTAYGTNATFGSDYTNAVLADGPALYYRLNDPQSVTNVGYPSTNFPVAANYGSLSTAANGLYQPGTTPGVQGPSYAGFGANSKAVAINGWFGAVDVGNSNIPAALNPTGAAPMTLVSWFQTGPADAPGRFQEIVGHSDSSYRLALGQLAGENHFNPGPGPELQFTNIASFATSGFAFNDGNWHMVAGVSDGTNEFMYLDGALAQSSSNLTGIKIVGTTRDLLLGGDPQYTYSSLSTNTIRNFDGQIAHVAFWTNALSAAQIQSLFGAAGVPPYIFSQPQSSITNNAGQSLNVSLGLRGSAPISYQWYQNGVPVAGQTNATLSYASVSTSNAGTYYLVASNAGGSITSSVVNVVVFGPPTVLTQPLTQLNIFAGSSPVLQISAAGATPIYYQWTQNGAPVAGATNAAYTVANIQTSATYGCTLSNKVSTASINPVSITVLADPSAPYPTKVLSDGPESYIRLDETSGTTAYDYVGGYNGVYTNVTLGVPGYDSNGEQFPVQSDPTETAAEFGDEPPNDYAGLFPPYLNFSTPNGSNAEFSVEAWVTEYLYANGGNAIVALGYGGGGEQFVLDTGAGTAGTLRFFVRNAAGTVCSAAATTNLANDGLWHHVVGVCDEAGGHVYVYLDGVQAASATIPVASGILNSSVPMSIGARQSGNNGNTNYDYQWYGAIDDVAIYPRALSAAQVSAHYYAVGVGPSAVQVLPASPTEDQGGSVTFTAAATGTAPLGYQWSDENGNPIPGATNATLTLNNLQQAQSGNYSVTVTNLYGSQTASANLTVILGPPQLIQNIQPASVTAYEGDPVTLSIQASGSLPLAYQWYLNNNAIPGATNASYTFDALAGANSYDCSVTNQYSYSQSGGPLYSSTAMVTGVAVNYLTPTNYNSNLKITFAGYNRGEALYDFPVLVRLGASLSGFSYSGFASPTGGDLRFADESGAEIPYEIDQWDDSNGVASVWVQVPSLASTNDYVTAYWGNPAETNPPAYTTNGTVWVPPAFTGLPAYDVVYHLKESGFPYFDSTLIHPATNGVAPSPDTGIVGTGELFGGTDYLNCGTIDLPAPFTVSAWVNVSPAASNIQAIWASKAGGNSSGFALYINTYNSADQRLLLETGNGNNETPTLVTGAGAVSFGQWHMLAAAIDETNGTAQLYIDGVAQAVTGSIRTDFGTTNDVNFGQYLGNAFQFNGVLDESRIHASLDDSNWVWASYQTVASNSLFSAYSTITNTVSPAVRLSIQLENGNAVITWPNGTLQAAGVVAGPYTNVPAATSPYTTPATATQQYYRVQVVP
jgi:hypothetical protein